MSDIITVMHVERQKLNLTMEELAKKAGVDRKTIWTAENLVRYPNAKTRKAIKDALGYEGSEYNLFVPAPGEQQ